MFAGVGRRLALLNAAVVVGAIALSGLATFLLLRVSLEREADRDLANRIAATRAALRDGRIPLTAPASRAVIGDPAGDSDGDHDREFEGEEAEDDREERERRRSDDLLESGETLVYILDSERRIAADLRGIDVPGLPDASGVERALDGAADAATLRIGDEVLRVRTEPLVDDGRVIGAVQAARGEEQHREELELVRKVSLGGIALGTLLAVPAGLFLARRAMAPIGAAFERQRAFVADASHELRTPLALIRANAELARRLPDAGPETRAELDEVIAEVDGAARLVEDLLLLARADDPAAVLPRGPADLGAAARTAAAAMEPRARNAGLALLVDAPDGVTVAADKDRISQIVRILLDNAISYTPAGGTVRVTVERERGEGRVTVSDTGTGIDPAEQDRVFDRFYRTDASRTRSSGGSGLGLAIARALTEAYGGRVGLRSVPGDGATVWFTLPGPDGGG